MEQYLLADGPPEAHPIAKLLHLTHVVKLSVHDEVDIFHGCLVFTVGSLALFQLEKIRTVDDEFEGILGDQPEDGMLQLHLALAQIYTMVPLELLLGEAVDQSEDLPVQVTLLDVAHVVFEGHAREVELRVPLDLLFIDNVVIFLLFIFLCRHLPVEVPTI